MASGTSGKNRSARIGSAPRISSKLTIPNALKQIRSRRKQIAFELQKLRRMDRLIAARLMRV